MSDSTPYGGNPWSRTLASATTMADDLRTEGWEVVTVRAGHVAPEPPGAGDTDRFGYVYLAQGEVADAFQTAVAEGSFDSYEVFATREGEDLFLVTQVLDPDRRLVVLLVGAVDLSHATEMAAAARERGEMYSHVVLLDGTHLGSFHHDDPALLLPEDV